MDATRLLETQHREAEALFASLEKGTKDGHKTAVELARKLLAHMVIEQTIFYPAVKDADEDAIHEAYEEHHVARVAISRLVSTDADDDTFEARVTTLKELIAHHVKEEEKELFPKVRKALDADRLEELGAAMERDFDRLVERLPRTLHARAEASDVLSDVA